MATLQLQINAWDSGWPLGLVSNVDEPISSADGQSVSTTANSDVVIFDLDSASAIADIDTVNSITVTIRASGSITGGAEPGDPLMDVAVLIGGIGQGTESTGLLGASFSDRALTNVGWDSDWTQSQLNGMQIRVTSTRNGSAGTITNLWDIDTIDVVIDYTPLDPHVALPGVGSLIIAGKVPVSDLSDLFHQAQPAPANLILLPYEPWSDPVLEPASTALAIALKPVFANPLTEQLQINGWDSGWPVGLLSNIDEPSQSADGQVISTTEPGFDLVVLDFEDSTDIGLLDAVASIEFVIRIKVEVLGGGTLTDADVFVQPRINGVFKTAYALDVESAEGSFVNFTVNSDSNPFLNWDNAWEPPNNPLSNINGLQLYFTSSGTCTGVGCSVQFSLDTIDLIVTYASAGNKIAEPDATSLALSFAAPTLLEDSIRKPTNEALVLSGKSLTFVRDDSSQVSADHLIFSGQAPARISNHITLPSIGTLIAEGLAPIRLRDSIRMSAAGAAVLASQAPTVVHEFGSLRLPAEATLLLFEEAPLAEHSPDTVDGPGIGRALIDGKAVVIVETFDHLRDMPLGVLTLVPHLASLDSHTVIPAIDTLLLSGQAPVAVRGVHISVSNETLLFNGLVPLPATEFLTLTLAGHAPFTSAQAIVLPVVGNIVLTGYAPLALVATIAPFEDTLILNGQAPTVEIVTVLVTGLPRIISQTVVYDIEFIATPTDVLIG